MTVGGQKYIILHEKKLGKLLHYSLVCASIQDVDI
jgi:hypothetical protein